MAIDGPSGSGKSTVARAVGAALGLEVLDTGAMYRAVAFGVLDADLALEDGAAAAALTRNASIEVGDGATHLNGVDISDAIRGPEVTAAVSVVAAHPEVRAELVARQRAWIETRGGGVVEGRDIGSVVFPDAPVKVFLTASNNERARRRQVDETAARREVSVGELRDAMARRDSADSTRAASPLRTAHGANIVDTTGRTPEDIVAEIVAAFRAAEGAR